MKHRTPFRNEPLNIIIIARKMREFVSSDCEKTIIVKELQIRQTKGENGNMKIGRIVIKIFKNEYELQRKRRLGGGQNAKS